jgi:hypothetical protein
MPNVHQGSATDLTFYLESPVGVPANAESAELRWKIDLCGEENTETDYTNPEVGTYVFTITPDDGGILYAEFRTTNPDYIERYQVAVEGSVFSE